MPAERPAGLRARRISPSARASERAASPVLLTACALLTRCRRPQLRAVGLDGHRALDISATISRCDVDITVTRTWQQSRPRALPHDPGGAKPVPVKPVPVSRARCPEGAAPSAHCSTRSPSSTPCQLRPGHRRHDRHSKHHRGLHAGAASRHGSTASPPPARRQPTLTRVALTCIDTAHTTHSRHRLPLAHTSHSHGMACHSHSPLPLTLTLTLPLAQSASTPTPS